MNRQTRTGNLRVRKEESGDEEEEDQTEEHEDDDLRHGLSSHLLTLTMFLGFL